MCLLILQFCCFQPELLAEPLSTVLKKFSSSQMHDSEDVGILIAELKEVLEGRNLWTSGCKKHIAATDQTLCLAEPKDSHQQCTVQTHNFHLAPLKRQQDIIICVMKKTMCSKPCHDHDHSMINMISYHTTKNHALFLTQP